MKKSCLLVLLLVSFYSIALAKDPQVNYMMECQGCHLADGSGGVSNIPPLNNHVAKFLTVPGGREYLAQVPGVARSPLNDEEVTGVLNWLLHEFGPKNIAEQIPPYTVAEISRLRKIPLTEVVNRRAELIERIRQQEKK